MIKTTRNRYLVYNLFTNKSISFYKLKKQIWVTYQTIYGLNGTTEAGLYFEEYNENTKLGLIRCTQKSLSNLITILSLITTIDDNELIINPLFVSGLKKKAKKYLERTHTFSSTKLNFN